MSRSADRILVQLKMKGPQTAGQLGRRLHRTSAAMRQQLAQLAQAGLVSFADRAQGVGRPARWWSLTEAARSRFPESYADLAVDLLGAVRREFGPAGVERLVEQRTRQQLPQYRRRLPARGAALARRVAALARLRAEEGYMASWSRCGEHEFELVENHCPICAAARICQGLCGAELELFRKALGPDVRVERIEHLLEGGSRCVYRIRASR